MNGSPGLARAAGTWVEPKPDAVPGDAQRVGSELRQRLPVSCRPAAGTTGNMGDTAVCTSVPITVGSSEDRCGYGDRLPFLVISPYTRQNYVSSKLINTASVVKFIENNWLGGKCIPGSFDAVSGSIDGRGGLLDFNVQPHDTPVILDPTTGAVVSGDTWYGSKGELAPAAKKK